MSIKRINLGSIGEQAATHYLRLKGYRIVERNYRRSNGEIDIIAKDGTTVVFVEVKTRRNDRFGAPAEAVTRTKQQQISRAALEYLAEHNLLDEPVRFDVIAVTSSSKKQEIDHIVSAFEPP